MKRWLVRGPAELKTFLSVELKISKSKAKELVDSRNVYVNDRRVWIATHLLRKGDYVEVADQQVRGVTSPAKEFTVLYEDEFVIAVNKPAGVVSDRGGASLESVLRREAKIPGLRAIHRLDRETSGAILYARNQPAYERFVDLWDKLGVKKTYLAIASGEAPFGSRRYFNRIEGKSARSDFQVIRKKKGHTYFRVDIETGRKHQIRIHLKEIGFPVLGDKEYGSVDADDSIQKSVGRQMLHAWKISYDCPFRHTAVLIEAPIPADFRLILKKTGLL